MDARLIARPVRPWRVPTRLWVAGFAAFSSLLTVPLARAAPVAYDFEQEADTAGWTAPGAGAALSITHDAQQVRQGKGALLCSFTGSPGAPFSLTRSDLEIAGARSLSVSLKASSQLPLSFRFLETDGSAYQLFVTCLPGQWCEVAAPLTDAQLEDGSSDENDRLDADQVASFTIQSLADLPGAMADLFGVLSGPQTLVVDDLAFRSEALPSHSVVTPGKTLADGFEEPALYLLPVGGVALARVPGHAGGALSAVSARFGFAPAGPQAWPGIVVPLGPVSLKNAKSLRLRMRSLGPLKFQVVLEEQDKSKFAAGGEMPAGGEWVARDFRLSDFKPDPTGSGAGGALDAGKLRVMLIVADCYNALLDDHARSEFAVADVLFLE
jgi:hypothetical protein